MRLLRTDPKRKLIEVVPEDKEDLWLLSLLILPGDKVRGFVTRRIKREGERGSGRIFRFKVAVLVEDVDFSGSALRIKGRIVEGPEDLVGKGKYQTMEVREGDSVVIEKDEWDWGVVEEIRRAEEESKHPKVLVVSLSDEEATVGVYERRIRGIKTVRRRGDEESLKEFFGEVLREIRERDEDVVVVGGPKVVIDEFRRFLDERGVEKKVSFVVSPLSGEKGLRDIVGKRASHVIRDQRRRVVEEKIEEFLMHLAKGDGLASLEPEKDAEMGNVETLLVHEEWIKENRKEAHNLMRRVKEAGGEVLLVSKDYEGEGIVRKLGGRIGIRRYRL